MLAPLVFERQRPVTSIRADRAAPSTVFTMVSLPRRFWKEPVLRSQGRNGSRKERVSEKGGGEREKWRSKPVMAAGGWFPPSRPPVTHSPHTAFSLHSLTISWVLFYSCRGRTHPHTHFIHFRSSSHAHTPCCFGLSFRASIGSSIKIFTGSEAPWSSDRDTTARTVTKAEAASTLYILLE